MTEQEALIRAREAAIAGPYANSDMQDIRSGRCDDCVGVQAALRALLDLDKPLPVDRDLADLRELLAARCLGDPTAGKGPAENYRRGVLDDLLKPILPTFRAIIQRRIEEAGK